MVPARIVSPQGAAPLPRHLSQHMPADRATRMPYSARYAPGCPNQPGGVIDEFDAKESAWTHRCVWFSTIHRQVENGAACQPHVFTLTDTCGLW